MTPFIRWLTFNLVGIMGMTVQLVALALFNRLLHDRYLLASAAALELTLLHNFVWHLQFTWRDRRDGLSRGQQLLRFHISNGLVSLTGNLALMRLLVHAAHLPLLLASASAILCCSAANFWVSQRWAFSAARHPMPATQFPTCAAVLSLLLPLVALREAHAQLPDAPSAQLQRRGPGSASTWRSSAIYADRSSVMASYAYYGAAFCGMGASTSKLAAVPAAACGAGISFPIAPLFVEIGLMGLDEANCSHVSAYLTNLSDPTGCR